MSKQLGLFMEEQIPEVLQKKESDKYSFTLNKDTILIYLLSKYYGYNLNILHLLYEKYDKDLLYFFYMQPIKKGNIPSFLRISYLIKSSNSMLQEIITKGYVSDTELDTQNSKDIIKEFNSMIDVDKMVMYVDLGMYYDFTD